MGVFVRVVKGNQEAAVRNFYRVLASGAGGQTGSMKMGIGRNAGRVRPGEARRQARELSKRRREAGELQKSLAVVFARRARGF